MWKEKYEALKVEFDQLRAAHDALARKIGDAGMSVDALPHSNRETVTGEMAKWFEKFPKESLEATYQYVRKRMREENPEDLLLGIEKSRLSVEIKRPVITVSATENLFGRICQLTSEGFFKEPQTAKVATAEAVRRGWCHPKTPFMRVQDPLEKLAGMGFLTRETDGYQMVPGMKISVQEAEAK